MSVVTTAPTPSAAQSTAGGIELPNGPVLGSARLIGMGGAYASVAEGLDGLRLNPASVANREMRGHRWVDYDVSLGLSLLATDADYENDGHVNKELDGLRTYTVGAQVNLGGLGFACLYNRRLYAVRPVSDFQTEFTFDEHLLSPGYHLERFNLVLGASLGFESMRMLGQRYNGLLPDTDVGSVDFNKRHGNGISTVPVGGLYGSPSRPLRLAAAFRWTSPPVIKEQRGVSALQGRGAQIPSIV